MTDYEFQHTLSNGQQVTICCNNLCHDPSVGLDYYWDEVYVADENGDAVDLSAELEDEIGDAAADRIVDYELSRSNDIYP